MCKEKPKEVPDSKRDSIVVRHEDKLVSSLIEVRESNKEEFDFNLRLIESELEQILRSFSDFYNSFNPINMDGITWNDDSWAAFQKILPLLIRIDLIGEDVKKELLLTLKDVVINDRAIPFLKEQLKAEEGYYEKTLETFNSSVEEAKKDVEGIKDIINPLAEKSRQRQRVLRELLKEIEKLLPEVY